MALSTILLLLAAGGAPPAASTGGTAVGGVWPLPSLRTTLPPGGEKKPRCAAVNLTVGVVGTTPGAHPASDVLIRGAARYEAALRRAVLGMQCRHTDQSAGELTLVLLSDNGNEHDNVDKPSLPDVPGPATNYSYSLSVPPVGPAHIGCVSPFGCMYGLETLLQEVLPDGSVASGLTVRDAPEFAWRGMMLDVSSRFAPVAYIKSQLDAMAAVKMSVLHLHLSEGAYRLPTAALPSLNRGVRHYSSTDVAAIINYATDRGIRVVPEVDVSPAALPAALATSLYALQLLIV